MATLERAGAENPVLLGQHLARYHFALNFIAGKRVLDFGCGQGYGSKILAGRAGQVTSLDIAEEATQATKSRGITRVVRADARRSPLRGESFDVVVSFEVFEHIEAVEQYLAEVGRMLAPGGRFIVSTPNREFDPMAGMNPFHFKEYTYPEVADLLAAANLKIAKVFAQIPAQKELQKLERSKLLLTIMKAKRAVGFHGDLLPASLQGRFKRAIAGGEIDAFDPESYNFVEGKIDSAELIYVAEKG